MDLPLAHLDRPFDYLVPAELDAQALPGVRVKVRFAGQLVDGWLLERVAESDHPRLAYLEKVVSPVPVLAPEVARLARAVADRYAGSLADVLRLAVPPRHARVEKDVTAAEPAAPAADGSAAPAADGSAAPAADGDAAPAADGSAAPAADGDAAPAADGSAAAAPAGDVAPAPGGPAAPAPRVDHAPAPVGDHAPGAVGPRGWRDYPAGLALLRALADGRAPRAVWSALPGEDWAARYADAVAATVVGGRGAVVVVADARDLDRLDAALTGLLGPGRHVCLSAALGPARRYRAFLAALGGDVPVVIGTRAAMFAPAHRLGLVAIWDDGDDLHAEPRAPYPHAREVLLTRAQLAGAAALVGGYARTAEAQLLVETGWAREVVADRATVRARMPAIAPAGDDPHLARDPGAASARLPSLAWTTARDALRADLPVLVQVPRRGYLPSVACADCRTPARCAHCAGPLALPAADGVPACRWCGRVAAAYACPECGGRRLRAAVTGARRTAEELGRAFPGVPVRTSGREEVLSTVPGGAGLVIATPGAEPVAEGGYGAVLLLDSWALLTRADLRAGEEALRRWQAAAALARPGAAGGRVVVVADGALAPVQALLRWDAAWFAARELAERRELGFPPAVRMASVTGAADAVADLLAGARLPDGAEVLGPVPADEGRERMLVRVPRARAAALAEALHAAAGQRSARKAVDPVRLQVDPLSLF
ncbi:primosomal protein N' [Micromonospora sp. DR5-3]|uniref:primosomal protein N' n=1 Tax=unclassified Micromonospora TaxID=2617518 RepID=UPI0011D72EE5|nr:MULTISPECIES: primosomal protein N' [unclassified Micromonospora]MCW3817129.1 primosomal protein N' [Micromonospora sp. DR5-3]TYC22348.1 primosomal protein N' [Micromonospora sp. MP36]